MKGTHSLSIDERRRRLKGTALIDWTTGIATSHEFSRVPLFLVRYIVQYSPEEAAKLLKDVVDGYRLASWPVSLGYLRDMPISGETKEYHKTRALRDPMLERLFFCLVRAVSRCGKEVVELDPW